MDVAFSQFNKGQKLTIQWNICMHVFWNPLSFSHPQDPKTKGFASFVVVITWNDKTRVSHKDRNVMFLSVGRMADLQSLRAIK